MDRTSSFPSAILSDALRFTRLRRPGCCGNDIPYPWPYGRHLVDADSVRPEQLPDYGHDCSLLGGVKRCTFCAPRSHTLDSSRHTLICDRARDPLEFHLVVRLDQIRVHPNLGRLTIDEQVPI